ncbi:DUF6988 family protein [Ectopseudomonas oleovorans]|uniref:DUF6988 family protein n=1 Tax=Ectopseudomonas oleovorans TaxID=301 RepID=UPI000CF14F40|nr:hypothetical protein [Pseudomonas oleovorans]PPV39475.1 hypothetical protein C5L43_10690 [Pseudomonas oleovorans]
MELDQLLARSAVLEERIADFFALPLANSSPRLQSVQTLTSLGFEHATSLKHLVAARLCTSAAALLRVQYESLVRALWVLYCASDAKAEQLLADLTHENAKTSSKIPMLSGMLEDIEKKAPHAPVDKLKEFKHYAWRPLSSFVHGGIHAVNRHGRGFPLELVHMQVRHSNGLLGIAGNLLLIIAGVPPEQQVMTRLYAEFSDCFPPINPPYPPRAEAAP